MLEKLFLIAALGVAMVASSSVVVFLMRARKQRVPRSVPEPHGSPYRTRAPSDSELAPSVVPEPARWWGKHGVIADAMVIVSLASAAALLTMLAAGDEESSVRRWAFTRDAGSTRALGLAVTSERAGVWRLERDPRATGARALVNDVGLPGSSPAMAIALEPAHRDVRVRTRCRVRGSGESLACGLVFRHRDRANYYSARVDAKQQRVVLSVVANGKERIIARAPARVEVDVWQEIAVDARRDRIRVVWNDETTIEVRDSTHLGRGAAGLWTAATTAAHFDELWLERLPGSTLQLLSPGFVLPRLAG